MMLMIGVASVFVATPRTASAAAATTTTDLNLRSGPGTSFSVILVMPWGATVEITGGSEAGFSPVIYSGASGWAANEYLSTAGGTAPPAATGPSGGAVVSTALNLRAGPSTSDTILTVMPSGAMVTLTGESANGFAQVVYNGATGWAFAGYLGSGSAPVDPAPAPGFTSDTGASGAAVATTALNLRAGPSTSDAILTVMPAGAAVMLNGSSSNGFDSVTYNGTAGWAFSSYLSSGGAAATPPATAAPPPTGSTTDWVVQIIYDAADRYGQPREDMLRVARCESNLDPNAVNAAGGSYGLFQFIPGTWATTPYADQDIFDAWANANAAGWMWSVGRRGEWVCQ